MPGRNCRNNEEIFIIGFLVSAFAYQNDKRVLYVIRYTIQKDDNSPILTKPDSARGKSRGSPCGMK